MSNHGGNGGTQILPAATLLEEGSHLSRWHLQAPVVVFKSQVLRRKLDFNY